MNYKPDNTLAVCYPKLALEWHPTKNKHKKPEDVTHGSTKKAWWVCSKGHEWEARISHRSRGHGCPYCSGRRACENTCLATINPDLSKEWHPTNNKELTPYNVKPKSHHKVWWKCDKGHEWKAAVSHRTGGTGCPYCSGNMVCLDTCLATINPDLSKEWHPTKNGDVTPYNVTKGYSKKVWWQCGKGHEWETTPHTRLKGHGCPYCSGRRASETHCLAVSHSELIEVWHPTKNGRLSPYDVTPRSTTRAWWVCSKGHEYDATVCNRSKGHGCPYCSGIKVCEDNCLATVKPELSKEWHPTNNKELTPYNITRGSTKKVWWKCSKGHEWQEQVKNRSRGHGCPYCSGRRKSKTKRILCNLLNIWTKKEWPYASAGKEDVCDMIMTELDIKGYDNLNFLSLPGNGREIHNLHTNGFELNYNESIGVEKKNVRALREYFLTLFRQGELNGLLPIVRANIDDLVINNEDLPEFNAIHLDYNGPLIYKHILAVEAALRNNPDAIVAITVNRYTRFDNAMDYKFGDFPFINMNPELLFYQPYEGKKPMPWRDGAPMETYCFQNRR
jgi:hypothetical protein